jgi:hypothetical protein
MTLPPFLTASLIAGRKKKGASVDKSVTASSNMTAAEVAAWVWMATDGSLRSHLRENAKGSCTGYATELSLRAAYLLMQARGK